MLPVIHMVGRVENPAANTEIAHWNCIRYLCDCDHCDAARKAHAVEVIKEIIIEKIAEIISIRHFTP